MHALWPSRRPHSDNVVGQLRCGPVWSAQFAVWLDWRRPAEFSTISIRPSRRGGGDGDHPSFLTQALHPQLNNEVGAMHPSKLSPLKSPLVKAQSSVGKSVLHFAVTTDGSGPGRKPITVASAPAPHERSFASMARVQERRHTSMTKTERVFSGRPGPQGSAWTSQGRNWDEHARTDLEAD